MAEAPKEQNHLYLVLELRQQDMVEVENSVNKRLYKITLVVLKVIPMLLALCTALNTILALADVDNAMLSYIGGISFLPLLFLYLTSYVFRFCEYHRMFLHYILVTNIVNIYDFYIGIPLSDKGMVELYAVIAGVFLFVILYLYRKDKCCKR